MRTPEIDDHVCLTQDLPERALFRGESGVVLCQWFAPDLVFEVEFNATGLAQPVRALVAANQIIVEERARLEPEAVRA
ncbi:MAG: DUF4926 domain-containing protein [Akkermansiaceae bacterium]|nr:DUF4926 domain-containing protein [Verrucomicrobiales bacterium]